MFEVQEDEIGGEKYSVSFKIGLSLPFGDLINKSSSLVERLPCCVGTPCVLQVVALRNRYLLFRSDEN